MTTKEDVRSGFESIGKFIETIGNTIKENKRKQQVEKVLSQFNNPDKIFLNADGTPKSDSEIAPMLNQGVMSLYQLGEDKLANSLTQYFGQMSKSFDKTSQNAFEYDYKSDGKYFPKQDGKPIAFNERTDYSGVRDEKEFAPRDKKFYAPKSVNLGDRVQIYEWDADKQIWNMREEDFNKPANVNYNYGYNTTNITGQEQMATYTDPNGKIQNITYKDGKPYYSGTNTPVTNMEGWLPQTENANFDKDNGLSGIANRVMGSLDMSSLKNNAEYEMVTRNYKNEIQNWINGGVIPSFMTTEWIAKNQATFRDILKLKGK